MLTSANFFAALRILTMERPVFRFICLSSRRALTGDRREHVGAVAGREGVASLMVP
jgi:hypothetical protein